VNFVQRTKLHNLVALHPIQWVSARQGQSIKEAGPDGLLAAPGLNAAEVPVAARVLTAGERARPTLRSREEVAVPCCGTTWHLQAGALVSVERPLLIEELLRERCLHELFQEDEKSRALAPIVEEYSGGAWRMTAMLQR
jgi:hypothetical protein